MTDRPELRLHEEVLLLALKDEQGTLAADQTKFTYTVAASFLAELLMAKRIKVEEDTGMNTGTATVGCPLSFGTGSP